MRSLALLGLTLASCGYHPASDSPDATGPVNADAAVESGCPADFAGAACVLALYDQAIAGCEPAAVDQLRTELDLRAELGPLWAGGRALFRTDHPTQIAGEFDGWSQTALGSTAVCGSDLIVAVGAVPSGYWAYKLFDGQTWSLDPRDPAFAYDDFVGNSDGKNSVLDTPDSGRGHLVLLDRACSTTLGNCRDVTAYYPAGYTAPANATRTYPVLFMHDGQNVWDDHDCCFGHTGWELNVTLDNEIAAGRVAPIVVIAAASTTARNDEYGLDATRLAAFLDFQITELQPHALAKVRWNGAKVAVAGSSLGGLVSIHLALGHPELYAGAASLSGAFWPGMDDGTAVRDRLAAWGKQPVAIYLDHGGNVATNADGAADSVEVRDRMIGLGWQRQDSPTCALGPSALCYFMEPAATHDELAWQARSWRFLRFLFPG